VPERLKFVLEVDADASKVEQLKNAVMQLEGQLGQRLPGAAAKTESSFRRIGELVAGLGIERMLEGTILKTLEMTNAWEQFEGRLQIFSGTVVGAAMRGFKAIADAQNQQQEEIRIGAIRHNANIGLITKAQADAQIAALRAKNRALKNERGLADDDEIREIMLQASRTAAAVEVPAAERLASLKKSEAEAIDATMRSAQYQTLIKLGEFKKANNMLQAVHLQFDEMDRRITTKAQQDEIASVESVLTTELTALTSARDRKRAILADEYNDVLAGDEDKLRLVDQATADEMAIEQQGFELRMAALEEENRIAPQLVEQTNAKKVAAVKQHEAAMTKLAQDGASARRVVENAELQQKIQFTNKLLQVSSKAAADELLLEGGTSRALKAAGAASLRQLGQEASNEIMIQGARAAWRTIGTLGVAGIPAAAAIVAAAFVASTAVAAVSGAAANAMAPIPTGNGTEGLPGPGGVGGGGGTFTGTGFSGNGGGGAGGGPSAGTAAVPAMSDDAAMAQAQQELAGSKPNEYQMTHTSDLEELLHPGTRKVRRAAYDLAVRNYNAALQKRAGEIKAANPGTPAVAAVGGTPFGTPAARSTIIQVSTLNGQIPPETLSAIEDTLLRADAS
jgi:hypothetical protein